MVRTIMEVLGLHNFDNPKETLIEAVQAAVHTRTRETFIDAVDRVLQKHRIDIQTAATPSTDVA